MPDNSPQRTTAKKWLLRAAKLLVVALVIWAVHKTLYEAWCQLHGHRWHIEVPWLLAAGAFYLAGMAPAALFWHLVLRAMGQPSRLWSTFRAYSVGHLGKYVHGKAMVVVIRTGLVCSEQVNAAVAAVSVFVETLTMMAAGSFLSAAILAIWYRDRGLPWYVSAGAVGLLIVSGLPTWPPLFRLLVRLAGVGRSSPETGEKLLALGYKTLLAGWLLMSVMWVLWGLSYWATLRAMGVQAFDPIGELPVYTLTVSLATVAGFVAVVMPAGAGIREAVLAVLIIPYLAPLVPNPHLIAWASAIVLRVVWLVAELLVSLILYPLGMRGQAARAGVTPVE